MTRILLRHDEHITPTLASTRLLVLWMISWTFASHNSNNNNGAVKAFLPIVMPQQSKIGEGRTFSRQQGDHNSYKLPIVAVASTSSSSSSSSSSSTGSSTTPTQQDEAFNTNPIKRSYSSNNGGRTTTNPGPGNRGPVRSPYNSNMNDNTYQQRPPRPVGGGQQQQRRNYTSYNTNANNYRNYTGSRVNGASPGATAAAAAAASVSSSTPTPSFGSGTFGAGGSSAGGGGGQVVRLDKPLKLQRIAVEQQDQQQQFEGGGTSSRRNGPPGDNNYNNRGGYGGTSSNTRGAPGGYRGDRASTTMSNDPTAQKGNYRTKPNNGATIGAGGILGPIDVKDSGRKGREKSDRTVGAGNRKSGAADEGAAGNRKRQLARSGERRVGDDDRRTSLRVDPGKKGRTAESNARRSSLKKRDRSFSKEAKAEAALERKTVYLPERSMSVAELAELIGEKPVGVIKFLMSDLGVLASMTQTLDPATCIAVAEGFGMIIGGMDEEDEELMDLLAENSALSKGIVESEDDPDLLRARPPVVTIMGHVDHGKTSLLDSIRHTDVTAGEAGGITQHIATYQVSHKDKKITFIDTPGHAAFTDMRQRGANITDIVILVVAADEGVKPQTADSIACARQAGVPIVVAVNKCDLDTADPMRVMTDLTAYDLLTEDLGGEVLSSQISAKTGANLEDLLDKIMLQAEILDLKANPDRPAEGIVVEANVERGLGAVATALIKKGTLRVGDVFVAGETYGRVRALISTADGTTRLKEAGPSVPVRVVGFEGVPSAGDLLVVAEDEQTARDLAESRQRLTRERESSSYQAGLMSSVARAFGSTKDRREMCVVVKADVQGSAEALTRALRELKLENDEAVVTIKVLVSEAGEVSKSDIAIASVTPRTTVLAFNVAASFAAMEDARAAGISIEYYNIVYDAIASVESRMQEVLSPTPDGVFVGAALVQEVFNIGGTGNIAGSRCTEGYLKKGANVRVMRGDKILIETKIKTLRSFKAETDSIEAGSECGIGLLDFELFMNGDIIECYVEK